MEIESRKKKLVHFFAIHDSYSSIGKQANLSQNRSFFQISLDFQLKLDFYAYENIEQDKSKQMHIHQH